MSAKPVLFLLHGALYSCREFDPLLAELHNDYRVEAFDFSGHGSKSGQPDPFRMEAFAVETVERIASMGSGPVHVFGFSMGGYVGLEASLRSPDALLSVMTLGTKFRWTPDVAVRETAKLDPDKIQEKVPQFASVLADRHGQDNWRNVVLRTAGMMRHLGDHPLLTEQALSGIEVPVRIGLGDRDRMVTIEETVQAYRALQNGSLQVFPETPHGLELTDTTRLSDSIRQFHADCGRTQERE